MFAQSLAAFCLLNLVVCPVRAASVASPDNEVVVYLTGDGGQPQRPLLYMKLELGRLMGAAGYRVEWTDARTTERVSTESALAVVELRGVCAVPAAGPAAANPIAKATPLASTAVSGGQIIPFSAVDCASLTRVLSPPLAGEPGARREFLYGRAMARLIAHELYHILLKTREHAHEGIARAGFTPTDLLTEHFEFEETTLAKMNPTRTTSNVTSSSEALAR